jgi:hypothetical protein
MPRLEPVRRNPELEKFAGLWVAVKDGHVLDAANTSSDLVTALRLRGDAARGAVVQYVQPPTDAVMIGVG